MKSQLTGKDPDAGKDGGIGKDPDPGKDGGQKEKEDEMIGWHHWLDGLEDESITDSDMSLSKFRETVKERGAWCAAVHGVAKSLTRLSEWQQQRLSLSWTWHICEADIWQSGASLKHFYFGQRAIPLPANAGDMGSIPDPERSHVLRRNEGHAPHLPSLHSGAWEPQQLSLCALGPTLWNRSHHNEKSMHLKRVTPTCHN